MTRRRAPAVRSDTIGPDAVAKTAPPARSRRYMLLLLPCYPLLVVAGVLTHRQIYPLLALALVSTALLLPQLLARRVEAWVAWSGWLATLVLLSLYGYADLLLEALPILINALLACWFGRTLATSEPLVARFIIAIEGAERLRLRGVAEYARRLTWLWTILLGTQALLLSALLLGAEHSGVLARLGIASPLHIPERWAEAWLHLGCYLLLGVVFVLEYGYRRWRLRHLSHPGLHTMLIQLVRHWPQLLHGTRTTAR
jgi:uncharacterized membrane protein